MSDMDELCPTCGAYWECDCPADLVSTFRIGETVVATLSSSDALREHDPFSDPEIEQISKGFWDEAFRRTRARLEPGVIERVSAELQKYQGTDLTDPLEPYTEPTS